MTFRGFPGGRRALTAAAAGLFVALACSTPEYTFVNETVEHCGNHLTDTELGESDVDCGGPDCRGCTYGQDCNDSSDCADGQCLAGQCEEPGCDNHVLDGDETGIDCGGSCPACREGQPCVEAGDCKSKVCGAEGLCASATCQDGVRNGDELGVDCGGELCDGCGIGSPCEATSDCESASCDTETKTCALDCMRGTDECDGNLDDPCETNLLTDERNCNGCGKVCELSNAEVSCVGGACRIDSCKKPWLHCSADDGRGCDVNASTDASNCGGCGVVCPALHGTPSCVSSACVIDCDEGFGDCDADPLTGCETSTHDVDNCGKCGNECPATGGEPYCVDGKCGVTPCDSGQGDCDGDHVCETGLDDDPDNCGRCGNVCAAANGSVACVNGQCVVTSCDDGWENCNAGDPDGGFGNGCETHVAADAKNCGGCGERCDTAANGRGICTAGACSLDCDAGFADCDGKVSNGCETDTTRDPEHCGGCKNACDIPNADAACIDSQCVIDQCQSGFDNCTNADGCETDTSSSTQHCGSCAHVCSNAGATKVTCREGACAAPSCDRDHGNCDGDDDNGCERDLSQPSACGSCDNACSSGRPSCVLSGDTYACQARITIASALPYPTQQRAGSDLSFNVTPRAGTDRMILLSLAADGGSGLAGSRPSSVRFGDAAMIAGPTQVGAGDAVSPDLFVYYLPLGDSSIDEPQVTVTLSGTESALVTQALELAGVAQDSPIADSNGGYLGTGDPEAPDPSVLPLSLTLSASGSMIVSFIATTGSDGGSCPVNTPQSNCPTWSVTPSKNLTVTETAATAPLGYAGGQLRVFGMVVTAGSASLPDAGDYAVSWSVPSSSRMTHLAVVVAPAQSR